MMKIEALVRSHKLDEIKVMLESLEIGEVTISEVFCNGGPMAPTAMYRGAEYRVNIPRVKLEMLVSSLRVEEVVEAVSRAGRTGGPGDDGTILVYEVADAIRIRSGTHVEFALS
jgi:nitrogen regulatory protein P-II 1